MTTRPGLRSQRGAAALAVSMLLLFATSLTVLYVNRGLVFEQKASANQMNSTKALEAADAGIEWATGMLNAPYDIGSDCNFQTTTNVSFRKRYVMTNWNAATNPSSDVAPAADVFPGCRITSTGLSCNCRDAGTGVANLGTTLTPSFTVRFEAVAGDPEAVRVTSWGCTAMDTACADATAPNADANARVAVMLKLKPVMRAAPAAPLTCGTTCELGGVIVTVIVRAIGLSL